MIYGAVVAWGLGPDDPRSLGTHHPSTREWSRRLGGGGRGGLCGRGGADGVDEVKGTKELATFDVASVVGISHAHLHCTRHVCRVPVQRALALRDHPFHTLVR